MRLDFTREIAAPAEAVWELITEPEAMNTWSEAEIRLLSPGEGGTAGGVGTYREVRIKGPLSAVGGAPMILREVIAAADAPSFLVYRVIDAPFIRRHNAEMYVSSRGARECTLRWIVDAELAGPAAELGAKALLVPQLEKSIEALAREAQIRAPRPVAPSRKLDDKNVAPGLWSAAEAILREQRAIADRLEKAGDPKRWFSRVYEYVTEAQLEAARGEKVEHVGWVLRLIPRFHDYYADNLRRRLGELGGAPETHWVSAFDAMEGKSGRSEERLMLFLGLLKGIRAHIEEDLPRALAEIYVRDYADRCEYVRFRADFLSMGKIFVASSDRLIERVPRRFLPWYTRWFGGLMPEELTERLRRKNFYDVPRERLRAFERGARLATLLVTNKGTAAATTTG